jgi:hypothetical protein
VSYSEDGKFMLKAKYPLLCLRACFESKTDMLLHT